MSALTRLAEGLDSVVDDLVRLVRGLSIRHFDRITAGAVFFVPEFYWNEPSPEQKHQHIHIVRRYKRIFELLSAWLLDAPNDLRRELDTSNKTFAVWLELGSNWALSPDQDENERGLREAVKGLKKIIAILGASPTGQTIVVPDTNSLIREPDPTQYRLVCGVDRFEFVLLPTVLQELDSLKVNHRNEALRDKAQRAITRIKGWRTQGSLVEGVTVDKSITVCALHQEPNVSAILTWLDPSNLDDRIIASVRHLQAASPAARILLATGDINLQNKADAVLIEVGEVP